MPSILVFLVTLGILLILVHNVWKEIVAENNCNQNCDQGRNCTYKEDKYED